MAEISTARQTFRETVAAVAEKARARLPQTVNGRIESAVKLVLMCDVMLQADGTILVGSSSDALKSYLLTGQSCECQDFTRGHAPDGWCQHRIAAGIAKRVQELTAQSPPVETETAPAPLPEAPVSITLKAMLHGHEIMVTLRGTDFASVKVQVEAASAWLKAHAPAPQDQGAGWCKKHAVPMTLNQKEGRSWFSHRLATGDYCKGR